MEFFLPPNVSGGYYTLLPLNHAGDLYGLEFLRLLLDRLVDELFDALPVVFGFP